jgi:hypothetical protein
MNISTGISEINSVRFSGASPVKQKTFIWPAYTDGKVERINAAGPRPSGPVYYKPSSDDENKLLNNMKTAHGEYNSSGRISRTATPLQPGSLFNALA